MKTSTIQFAILAFASGSLLGGCSTVNSSVYTQGAIQSSMPIDRRRDAFWVTEAKTSDLGALKVVPFTESRWENPPAAHNLAAAFFPVFCVMTYWDRSDWMQWGSDEGAYKPVGLDVAETISLQLRHSDLFADVVGPSEAAPFDYVLEGDVSKYVLRLRPHLCGVSIAFAPMVGVFGIPLGSWTFEQKLEFRLRRAVDGRLIWQSAIATQATGAMAAYHGGNPMQFGYPYDACLAPVIRELLATLPQEIRRAGLPPANPTDVNPWRAETHLPRNDKP